MSLARSTYNRVRGYVGALVRNRPRIRRFLTEAEHRAFSLRHSAATLEPRIIRPRPHLMMIAVTSHCNARCIGCRYGRDFMPNSQLGWEMTRDLLDDARQANVYSVRLYGGEPLLHPELPRMVEHCRRLDLHPYVTTNAVLLGRRIDDLYAAGLRDVTVGFYGVGDAYDRYAQRPGLFERVEEGIATARDRYGDSIEIQMNWLLMRPSCSLPAFHAAHRFAQKYNMRIRIDLVHYSLPYFTEGPERVLQFRPEDRPAIEELVAEFLKIREAEPNRFVHTATGLRSIPDWLTLGPAMKVPCTAYEMIWVGADGTVQLCYVTFKLGNLHEERFRDMVNSPAHRAAARDAFLLNCPNCHCDSDERIQRHAASRRRYRG